MDEQPRTPRVSPEIYVYATNKNFLNIYDALRIEKVKIEVAGYDQASGRQTGLAGAWLDVDDLRLLAHLVTTRQFKDVVDRGRFERFGGSDRDGGVESRTILIEWDPGDGKFARFPYRVTIANGPGQRTQNGAVQPKGEPTTRLSMRLPEPDMIKIMLAIYDYVRAYDIAHHHRIVAQKLREVQEKLAGRPGRQVPVAPAPEDEPHLPGVSAPAPARPAPDGSGAASPGSRVAAAPARPPAPLHVVPGGAERAAARPATSPALAAGRQAPPTVAAASPRPAARPAALAADNSTPRPVRSTRTG